jgi:glucosyl-3-phosphoglycerate phosphatase
MMDRLVLVRHGETEWNARRVLQGQADIALSERGREQARDLRDVVRTWMPDMVVCSDLARARETAAVLGYANAKPDPRWREADLGEWTGMSSDQLKRDCPEHHRRWRDGLDTPPKGESFTQLCQRIATAIDALRDGPAAVLVVTHGGAIRAALSGLLGLQPNRIVPVDPASATVIQMNPGPRLAAFNVYRHLPIKETTD